MQRFRDKRILITGAASGIGRLLSIMLARAGAELALADINRAGLAETQRQCAALGARVRVYPCDLSRQRAIDALYGAVKRDGDRVDILINNAGVAIGKFVHEYEYEDLARTMRINFIGSAYLTRLALPDMMRRNRGHIVNIASAMGLTGLPRMGEYVASKHAIVGFTDTLRMELSRGGYRGIKTLCVCPSGIDTGMFPGYRAPLLSPVLSAEIVARHILRAILRGKTHLRMPLIVKFIPAMKLLPAPLQDVIGRVTGMYESMVGYDNSTA